MALEHCLRNREKGLNGDSNPDLCDASAAVHQLSYQANWEVVIMWVTCKPEDVEIHGNNRVIMYLKSILE